MLAFLCCSLLLARLSWSAPGELKAEPTWLAGAVDRSSPGTGLVGDKLCSLSTDLWRTRSGNNSSKSLESKRLGLSVEP